MRLRPSLRVRILGAFLLSFAFFLTALGYGLVEFRRVGQALEVIDQAYVPLSAASTRMESSLVRMEIDLDAIQDRRIAAHRSRAALHHGIIRDRVDEARATVDSVRDLARDESERADLESLDRQLETIGQLNAVLEERTARFLDLTEAGDATAARSVRPELVNNRRELETAISQLSTAVDGRIRRLAEETAEAQRTALIVSGGLALAALGLGLVLLLLAVIALRPIGRMSDEVRRIEAGDYEVELGLSGSDELDLLAVRINAMAAAIRQRDEDLRRKTVEELARSDRLARAERLALVGQMLAQITHEVRNPLNAMSLNAELLAEDLERFDDGADLGDRKEEALAMLATVRSEIERLERTTEHYLALARRPAPCLEPVEPSDLVQGVANLLGEQLRREGIVIELDVRRKGMVELDGNQMRQALINVVRNAAESGATSIRVEVTDRAGMLDIAVCDDGRGLDAESAARAFDPFFTTKAKGSGIGLAITRQILEDHGGTVALEPSDSGTRLVLRVPA